MAIKQSGTKTYTTMHGKQIDIDLLRQRNELTQAVGNAKVNARGDELGPGGVIIRKREEVLADYYRDHPKNVPTTRGKQAKKEDEWVEDAQGNFVKKK